MTSPLTFLHLSDIHFKEPRAHGDFTLNTDLRDQLQQDVATVLETVGELDAILITGDIAFSGQRAEYEAATQWLSTLQESTRCQTILTVPGNHDVDRNVIRESMPLKSMRESLRNLLREEKYPKDR